MSTIFNSKKNQLIICFFVVCVYVFALISRAPSNFPLGTVVTITPGQSLLEVSTALHRTNVIGSGIIFRSVVILLGGEKKVIAGDYLLDAREPSFAIAYRLVRGDFHFIPVKVTIPEGWNVFQIGAYLSTRMNRFDTNTFLSLAKKQEGYLFPDTYFLSPLATPETIIRTMHDNYSKAIGSVPGLKTFNHSEKEVITMASIVEAEASTTESRRIVAGILWHRMDIGMPLQVDSTFSYINGKNTYELTASDLKIKSPYNTYINQGLPPTPINNPGLDSISATINFIKTDYVYFLSGRDGVMHYAKTFDEHKHNKVVYGG